MKQVSLFLNQDLFNVHSLELFKSFRFLFIVFYQLLLLIHIIITHLRTWEGSERHHYFIIVLYYLMLIVTSYLLLKCHKHYYLYYKMGQVIWLVLRSIVLCMILSYDLGWLSMWFQWNSFILWGPELWLSDYMHMCTVLVTCICETLLYWFVRYDLLLHEFVNIIYHY